MIARLEDGKWSAPSAISCLGVGFGAQAGLEFTDAVIILRDDHALNAFMQLGNFTVGANLGLALGPWGRSGEAGWAATCALTYSFNKTRGLFGGLSLEGTVFMENRSCNEKFYGKGAAAREILAGSVPSMPREVSMLHEALYTRFPAPIIPGYTNLSSNPEMTGQFVNQNNNGNLPAYHAHNSSNAEEAHASGFVSNEKERLLNNQ